MTEGGVNRRTLLRAGAIGTAAAFVPGPALAQSRPVLTHGVQSGDVTFDGGLVWTRADRPSRMVVEVSPDAGFRHARTVRGPLLTPGTGGTGRVRLRGLQPGREVHYRVVAEDLDGRARSEAVTGTFRGVHPRHALL